MQDIFVLPAVSMLPMTSTIWTLMLLVRNYYCGIKREEIAMQVCSIAALLKQRFSRLVTMKNQKQITLIINEILMVMTTLTAKNNS